METKPRILVLSTAYLPLIGGSELAIKHITDRLDEFDFDLVTGRSASSMLTMEQIGRVRVFRAGGRLAHLTVLLPKILLPIAMAITAFRLMRTHRYILIHAYQASQAGGAAWLLKKIFPRVPLIVTLQEGKELDRQPSLMRFFRGMILRSANRITAISNHLAAYARRFTHAPVDVIPNGVDLALFKPVPHQERFKKIIISVSRLVPKNGLANLIRSLPLVRAKVPARLVVIGGGPLRESLGQLATDLQVAGQVDFVGSISHDHLPEYVAQADVFARPSLSEGLGNAFLEAMACGVPVVASAVGGISDFLKNEETGLVCDPNDPASIAQAIPRLLTDTVLREKIIRQALDLVHERYDWAIIARHMGQVYHQVAHI